MSDQQGVKIVVITGVESSGKTTLTQALATHFDEPCVLETARTYLEQTNGIYEYEDLEKIGHLHWAAINEKIAEAQKVLFVDTGFIVLKIWSEEKYKKCAPWILNQLALFDPVAHILCEIDIPYEQDNLREHPNKEERKRLHQIYMAHMQEQRAPFIKVSGSKQERLNSVARFVQTLL